MSAHYCTGNPCLICHPPQVVTQSVWLPPKGCICSAEVGGHVQTLRLRASRLCD
jgi:hypothetical protein